MSTKFKFFDVSNKFKFFAMFVAMFTNVYITVTPLTEQVWLWQVIVRGIWTFGIYFLILTFGDTIKKKREQ